MLQSLTQLHLMQEPLGLACTTALELLAYEEQLSRSLEIWTPSLDLSLSVAITIMNQASFVLSECFLRVNTSMPFF
jgi:hypothetical protein